jgi:acyl-CoA dehydrogenase
MTAGHAFGIPPIIKFGSKALHEKFLPDLLPGKKRACIAITEPGAGSDVANIATTAKKTADGKHYIINGEKKWITNGFWSDYAAMAVRTGGKGASGLSMIVCPLKGYPGVTMRRLKVQGQIAAGTTYIELDDVKVPVENLIGEEGKGMGYVMVSALSAICARFPAQSAMKASGLLGISISMSQRDHCRKNPLTASLQTNFNHERLTIACGVTRSARVALSAAMAYVMKREAFGKTLVEQPVVRHRLAKAGAELEMMQAWVESFLYNMTQLSKEEADARLGGLTALAKAKAGMVLNECAQTAVLLFGGNGYTRTGQGEIAEKMYREVMGARIPGGSEDVMLDLAIRQLVKNYYRETAKLDRPKGSSKL